MNMKTMPRYYHSYLLRVWKEFQDDDYRVSLQDVVSCESHHFSNLSALMNFLQSNSEPTTHRLIDMQELARLD